MLSATDSQVDVHDDFQFRRFPYRTGSASISIPMNAMESSESQSTCAGHTGPLRNEKGILFGQLSGPLYVSCDNENVFQSMQGVLGHKTSEPAVERYPSSNVMDQNDWLDNSLGENNEHLLKSGQLGMCNDPYCTMCPTYYKPYGQRKKSKSSDFLDHMVLNFPSVPQHDLWRCKKLGKENCFFFSSLYSPCDESSCKSCSAVEQILCQFLLICNFRRSNVLLLLSVQQFRLAFVAPESRMVGAGDLVDHPKKIALHYLSGYPY